MTKMMKKYLAIHLNTISFYQWEEYFEAENMEEAEKLCRESIFGSRSCIQLVHLEELVE